MQGSAGKRLRWEDLAEEPFISREPGSGTRRAIEEHFARFGWSLRPRMTIESNEAIKESVAAGLGIAILSRHTLIHTAPGNLVELDVEGFPIPNRWYLVRWRLFWECDWLPVICSRRFWSFCATGACWY